MILMMATTFRVLLVGFKIIVNPRPRQKFLLRPVRNTSSWMEEEIASESSCSLFGDEVEEESDFLEDLDEWVFGGAERTR